MPLSELERRLRGWADEYAGGRYDYVGWPSSSSLMGLMTFHGRAPDGLHQRTVIGTAADEVEAAVQALTSVAFGPVYAAILRTDYWMRSAALEHKRHRLREVDGIRASAESYARLLAYARSFVAGKLGIDDDAPPDPEGTLCAKPISTL